MTSRVTPFTYIPILAADWTQIEAGEKQLVIYVDVDNKVMDIWRLVEEIPADGTQITVNVKELTPMTYEVLGAAETTVQSNVGGVSATMVYIREV